MESKRERAARGLLEKRLDRLARETRAFQRVRDRGKKVDEQRWRQMAHELVDVVERLDARVDNLRAQALAEVARLDTRISQVRDQALQRHMLLDARVKALEEAAS
jgi:hypothetical protein